MDKNLLELASQQRVVMEQKCKEVKEILDGLSETEVLDDIKEMGDHLFSILNMGCDLMVEAADPLCTDERRRIIVDTVIKNTECVEAFIRLVKKVAE